MGVIKQRTAYWVDMYRCQPPTFDRYDVDSYISFIEIGVDEVTGRRVGERPPKTGWQYSGEITYRLSNESTRTFPVIKRVRGGIFIEPDVPVNSVASLLSVYSQDIADRPHYFFDNGCEAASSASEISAEEPSVIASSYTAPDSSGIEEISSAFVQTSSGIEEISSALEEVSSALVEASSAIAEVSSAVEISSEVVEISSEVVEISSEALFISSGAPEISSEEPESSLVEISSAVEEFSSAAELSSAQEDSSALYSSSAVDICTALGCPGGVYGTTNGTGATEQEAIDDFAEQASSNCVLTESQLCASQVLGTQEVFPGLWVANGEYCCIEAVQVFLYPTLAMNTNEGVLEYDYVPGSNPHPLDQETALTDFYLEGSSSSVEYLLPNTITGVYFRGEWPKRECLEDGVSTIELFGEFSNPGTTSVVLTYNSGLSDTLSGGQPYFQNPNAGLASLIRLDDIVMTVEDCSYGSSSGAG